MKVFIFIFFIFFLTPIYSQEDDLDQLEEISFDVGDDFFGDDDEEEEEEEEKKNNNKVVPSRSKSTIRARTIRKEVNSTRKSRKRQDAARKQVRTDNLRRPITIGQFDVGREEQELLNFTKNIGHKMSNDEWSEVTQMTSASAYQVVENDTLWSISKTIFGTGFYYSKIWSLNPYITNPHQIEPGMVLTFSTGSEQSAPEIKLGNFFLDSEDLNKTKSKRNNKDGYDLDILSRFAEGGQYSHWLDEREELIKKGFNVQSTSDFTYRDLHELSTLNLTEEYKNYEPPRSKLDVHIPEFFDELGFDKSSIVRRSFASGFYLNTFIVSNIVQDFGEIQAGQKSSSIFGLHDIVYVNFDPQVSVALGDKFSIYVSEGPVEHERSEREGYRYTIKGSIQVIGKKNDLWECEVTEIVKAINRNDRITTYTPRIEKILTTLNQRRIEAIIIGAFERERSIFSFGDVVYIDRGRADGVELGNVFNLYSFADRSTKRQITIDPTYKIGELKVISLSENFATALVDTVSYEVSIGQLAISKTSEQAMRESKKSAGKEQENIAEMEKKALEDLDVELNLDDIGSELKEKADQIELSEEELNELERQEREKSFIKEHEQDRQELDRLEQEIEDAEGLLNEVIEDQNKQLEQQNLDNIEQTLQRPEPDAFESLDEIEEEVGKKYLDEDINARSNPYGLTEFDLEEVDELLNTGPEGEDIEELETEQLQ